MELGGGFMLGIIAYGMVALALALELSGNGTDWRWLRVPLAAGVIALALVVSLSEPWPDGLGLSSCEEQVNPALTNDAEATPRTIEVCSDLGVTAVPLLLSAALVLLLMAPDLSEFGIPGMFELKRRVEEQKAETAKLSADVYRLSVSASSVAESNVIVHNTINRAVEQPGVGYLRPMEMATLVAAKRSEEALLADLQDDLTAVSPPDSDISCSIYVYDAAADVLAQLGNRNDLTTFRPGHGATGQAFTKRRPVVVTGDAVHNDEYGLTPPQRELFAHRNIVGAAPIGSPEAGVDATGAAVQGIRGALTAVATVALPESHEEREALRRAWAHSLERRAAVVAAFLEAFGLGDTPRW